MRYFLLSKCKSNKVKSSYKQTLKSKMSSTAITSLTMKNIESKYTAVYIAELLEKLCIASVTRIAMEYIDEEYCNAYVDIKHWHDTESAYNLIKRLKNPNVETRLVHSDDDWWVVEINNSYFKTDKARNGIALTIFREPINYEYIEYSGSIDEDYIIDDDYVIDLEAHNWSREDEKDIENYIREIDESRRFEVNSLAYVCDFV